MSSDPQIVDYQTRKVRPWWSRRIAIVTMTVGLLVLSFVGWFAYSVLFTDWLPNQK